MTRDVVIESVESRPLAAVHRQVRIGEVARSWKAPLDQVWAFLGRHPGLRTDGHNVFLYQHPTAPDEPMEVYFGVQVTGRFEAEGEVAFAETPAGLVASVLHVGRYDQLRETHLAIDEWREAHGRSFAGFSWEIYGDPSDDPSREEVWVAYLLA